MVIDYGKLQIDKQNDTVLYNDEVHKYWTKDGNQACISVTTLIGTFETFDEDFWSSYKALEALVSTEEFTPIKKLLLDKKVFKDDHIKMAGVSKEDLLEKKNEILKEWEAKREESCVRGNAYHLLMENKNLSGDIKELNLEGDFKPDQSNKLKLGQKAIYPEILLSRISDDGKLRLAGQADLVIVDGNDVYIQDYKTSKKIDLKSYWDNRKKKHETLKFPLNHIQACNFMTYSLQMSTYAWMIQKEHPEANIKSLTLIHYDHDGNLTNYECEYMKNDVERMLVYYKKQMEHEEFKKSRKKIVF